MSSVSSRVRFVKPNVEEIRRVFGGYNFNLLGVAGENTKRPTTPGPNGQLVNGDNGDPATCLTFDDAAKHVEEANGLNVVLTGSNLTVIDIDGRIAASHLGVKELIAESEDWYWERSAGGNGIHGWGIGKRPADVHRAKIKAQHAGVGIEVYDGRDVKSMSVTGDWLGGSEELLRVELHDDLRVLSRITEDRRVKDWIDLRSREGNSEDDMRAACFLARHIRHPYDLETFMRR